MGIKDLVQLYEVVKLCRQLEEEYNWGFTFEWDQGTFETAIAINQKNGQTSTPPIEATWANVSYPWQLFCPDIVVLGAVGRVGFIEYDETPGKPKHGAKLAKKGHDPDGMDYRTERRNEAYKLAKIPLCVVYDYESDSDKSKKIKKFLVEIWGGKQ